MMLGGSSTSFFCFLIVNMELAFVGKTIFPHERSWHPYHIYKRKHLIQAGLLIKKYQKESEKLSQRATYRTQNDFYLSRMCKVNLKIYK